MTMHRNEKKTTFTPGITVKEYMRGRSPYAEAIPTVFIPRQ